MSNVLEKQLYAGILAVLNDKSHYYQSSIGKRGEYNQLRDSGREAIMVFVDQFAPLMIQQQNNELNERAKKLMWDELKK